MSEADRTTLKGDARLAEAVFGEGISGLISARATTVGELKGKSPELLEFLGNGLGQGLVKDNVITVEQLSQIPARNLKDASESLKNGESLDAARTLGLNADQTGALVASVRKTQEQFTRDLMPELQVPSPTPPRQPQFDPFNKQPRIYKI